jgi:hypothetical protein
MPVGAPQPRAQAPSSPLEGLAAALVHLKAAAVQGAVQEGSTVHLRPPGHVEDPWGGKAAGGQDPSTWTRASRMSGPCLWAALTCHTGIHQGHAGPREERTQHHLGEVPPSLGGQRGCRDTTVFGLREQGVSPHPWYSSSACPPALGAQRTGVTSPQSTESSLAWLEGRGQCHLSPTHPQWQVQENMSLGTHSPFLAERLPLCKTLFPFL